MAWAVNGAGLKPSGDVDSLARATGTSACRSGARVDGNASNRCRRERTCARAFGLADPSWSLSRSDAASDSCVASCTTPAVAAAAAAGAAFGALCGPDAELSATGPRDSSGRPRRRKAPSGVSCSRAFTSRPDREPSAVPSVSKLLSSTLSGRAAGHLALCRIVRFHIAHLPLFVAAHAAGPRGSLRRSPSRLGDRVRFMPSIQVIVIL